MWKLVISRGHLKGVARSCPICYPAISTYVKVVLYNVLLGEMLPGIRTTFVLLGIKKNDIPKSTRIAYLQLFNVTYFRSSICLKLSHRFINARDLLFSSWNCNAYRLSSPCTIIPVALLFEITKLINFSYRYSKTNKRRMAFASFKRSRFKIIIHQL